MTSAVTIDDPRYFERLAEVERGHWWSWGMWRLAASWLAESLRGRCGLRALDVGCGAGRTADRLAQRPEIGAVVGLDVRLEALVRARRFPHLWVRGSALALPFPNRSFDVITSFDVFQHLPTGSDRVAASEIRRVLSAGGVALIRANAAGFAPRPAVGGTVYRLEELTDAIGSAGLCVRRTSYANCLPALAQELRGRLCPISDSAGFPSSHPAGGGLRIQIPRPWINRLMASLTWAEALAAGPLGFSLPFGHSTLVLAEKS